MTARVRTAARQAASLADVGGPLLRKGLLVGALLLVFVTLHPFQSLGTSASIELSNGNETLTYVAFAACAAAALALTRSHWAAASRSLTTRPMLAMAAWLLVTSIISDDPATSLRRLVLFAVVFILAAALLLLAEAQTGLARPLAIVMVVVLVLSYGGVLLAPELAVHQVTDAGEPELAGDWRGVFGHKNDAAAVFSLFIFLGLFVARSGLPLTGLAVIGASLVFVIAAEGKSALALVGVAIAAAAFWRWRARGWLRVAVVLAPALLLNLFGVGSVLIGGVADLTRALPVDPTFTGRTDIWTFAIASLKGRLATGHGFDAFWNTAGTRFGGEDQGWAGTAAHAHNSYLDLVVHMGLPGLALGLLVFVLQPLRDVFAAEHRHADPAFLTMLQQIWLFGLYLSGMETIFFDRAGPVWITFLVALCGLRYAACYRLRRSGPL